MLGTAAGWPIPTPCWIPRESWSVGVGVERRSSRTYQCPLERKRSQKRSRGRPLRSRCAIEGWLDHGSDGRWTGPTVTVGVLEPADRAFGYKSYRSCDWPRKQPVRILLMRRSQFQENPQQEKVNGVICGAGRVEIQNGALGRRFVYVKICSMHPKGYWMNR